MSNVLFGITWARFHYCLYLPIVLGAIGIIIWAFSKRGRIIQQFSASRKIIVKHYSKKKVYAKLLLYMLGSWLLFLTLLQPRWGHKEQTIKQEGRDILVCFDISRSMLAQDCKPDRLTFAKNKIKQLLTLLSCERLGLLLFAESALVQCPLTNDHAAFLMFLDFIDAQTVSGGSTHIAQAIKKGIQIYQGLPSKKTKLLLICTDGEDFSPNLSQLRQQAQQEGIVIITFGIGTDQGAPIPLLDQEGNIIGHQKDEQNNIVISKLDRAILQETAQAVGGIYVQADDTQDDLQKIVSYVKTFEKDQLEDKSLSGLQERYPWFAAGSFICFLLEWLL